MWHGQKKSCFVHFNYVTFSQMVIECGSCFLSLDVLTWTNEKLACFAGSQTCWNFIGLWNPKLSQIDLTWIYCSKKEDVASKRKYFYLQQYGGLKNKGFISLLHNRSEVRGPDQRAALLHIVSQDLEFLIYNSNMLQGLDIAWLECIASFRRQEGKRLCLKA